MRVDPLQIAAWELVAGELRSEDLPALAIDALSRGVDSPTMGELAAQSAWDVRTSVDLFREVLTELDIELPERDEALWSLIRAAAREIRDGTVTPEVGAEQIDRWALEVKDGGDLRIFLSLLAQLDDHPDDRAELENKIVAEAVELLRRARPRVWIKLMAANRDSALTRSVGFNESEVDASELPIDQDLRRDLTDWNAQHAALLSDWPRSGGFRSVKDAQRLVEAGRVLITRLQQQLGPSYHVEYMPEPIRPPGLKLCQKRRSSL